MIAKIYLATVWIYKSVFCTQVQTPPNSPRILPRWYYVIHYLESYGRASKTLIPLCWWNGHFGAQMQIKTRLSFWMTRIGPVRFSTKHFGWELSTIQHQSEQLSSAHQRWWRSWTGDLLKGVNFKGKFIQLINTWARKAKRDLKETPISKAHSSIALFGNFPFGGWLVLFKFVMKPSFSLSDAYPGSPAYPPCLIQVVYLDLRSKGGGTGIAQSGGSTWWNPKWSLPEWSILLVLFSFPPKHVVVYYKRWCSLNSGSSKSQVDFKTPLIDMYANYDWGDSWADGNLILVAQYLRGSKRLRLPPEWRAVLPQHMGDEPMDD